MIIYNRIPLYDKYKGQLTEKVEMISTKVYCDYTGVIIFSYDSHDDEYYNNDFYASYQLKYADMDPCFGASGEEFDFGKKYSINMHEFLDEDYSFYVIAGGLANEQDSAEIAMMKHYLSLSPEREDTPTSFDSMCRLSRVRTATKLLEEGMIKPENLAGWYPSNE